MYPTSFILLYTIETKNNFSMWIIIMLVFIPELSSKTASVSLHPRCESTYVYVQYTNLLVQNLVIRERVEVYSLTQHPSDVKILYPLYSSD